MGLELECFFSAQVTLVSRVYTALCVEGREGGRVAGHFCSNQPQVRSFSVLSLIHHHLFAYLCKEEIGYDQGFLGGVLGLVEGIHFFFFVIFLCS